MENEFLKDELSDYALYDSTAKHESDPELRKLVLRLRETELKHAKVWGGLLGIKDVSKVQMPMAMRLKVWLYVLARRFMGIAFVTKLLERHEREGLEDYMALAKGQELGKATLAKIRGIIRDEKEHEQMLLLQTQKHEAVLDYTRSIVFGMNDGLVEILAVIAGVAMVATTGFVVALTGIIVGVSGTLSMAAGAYISSKSEKVVESSLRKEHAVNTRPAKEAYYTGIFYFIGALVATYPFFFGQMGYAGILESVVSVAAVLSVASALIAVMSDTSIRTRVLEMLAISLGTAFVTAVIGFVVRTVFGVAIS
jgi:VIT1/CCC1 family predicted Fe2+/Mn2+ transporter